MSKSFFERFGPATLGRGLWGKGSMPTRYKILFLGQSMIFAMAMWIRTQDVDKAQKIKILEEMERQKKVGKGESS
ncbi:hypothetical protein ACHAWF_004096 [Thalassiosira exigua]